MRLPLFVLLLLICIFIFRVSHAQEWADSLYHRPAQLTFITPLGTNGFLAPKTINNFSVNMLIGASAGVEGAELGGLFNYAQGAVTGIQVGGLGNYSSLKLQGFQAGGLCNVSTTFRGAQIGGLVNVNSHSEESSSRILRDFSDGLQVAGLVNVNTNPLRGVQIAGLVNEQSESLHGLQVGGISNNAVDIHGLQVAGIFNHARSLSGVQIGLINHADSVANGIQIGVLNFSKNGFRAIEVEYNESFNATVNFKMGVQAFYSILSVAYTVENGTRIWAPGQGFGSSFDLGSRVNMNIDAIHYWVNEGKWWSDHLNMLDKLKISAAARLTNDIAIYGGPSLNLQISRRHDAEGYLVGSSIDIPEVWHEEVYKNTRYVLYPGFEIGLRF